MTDDQYLELARQLLELKGQIAEIRVSVLSLKVFFLFQTMPDQIQDGLQMLRQLEEAALKSDPALPSRQQAADMIDAIQKLKKRGASALPDSSHKSRCRA
jgi:hypothetical protein